MSFVPPRFLREEGASMTRLMNQPPPTVPIVDKQEWWDIMAELITGHGIHVGRAAEESGMSFIMADKLSV